MTYEVIKNPAAEYAVDWPTIERLNRSFRLAEETWLNARDVRINESTWYNPFSWSLPTIINIEVDWEQVRKAADAASRADMMTFRQLAARSMDTVAVEMMTRVRNTHGYRDKFKDFMRWAQKMNSGSLQAAEDSYTDLIQASRFIRDTSADVVGIGATLMTGGAAGVAWMGASSTLKGVAKYQDARMAGASTERAATAGVLNFAGQFAFGAFKLKPAFGMAKLTLKGDYYLILAQGVFETGVSWVAGDGLAKAAQKGALKIVGDGGAKFLANTGVGKALLDKMPAPVTWVKQKTGDASHKMWVDEGKAMTGKVVEKVGANYGSKIAGPNLLAAAPPPVKHGAPSWTDDAVVYDEVMLQLAIIHMTKGIGHGW